MDVLEIGIIRLDASAIIMTDFEIFFNFYFIWLFSCVQVGFHYIMSNLLIDRLHQVKSPIILGCIWNILYS